MALTLPRGEPSAERRHRDHLTGRALSALTRSWLFLCPFAILVPCVIDLMRRPDSAWTQLPFFSLFLLHLLSAGIGYRYNRRPELSATTLRVLYRLSIVGCGLLGLMWVTLCAVIADRSFEIILVPMLIFGGLLMAPCRAGALLFTTIATVGGALAMPPRCGHELQVLASLYGMIASAMIVWQHSEFARGVANEANLEEQAEIIGILLHDYEEQGSDWLWETDEELRLRAPSDRLLAAIGCSQPMVCRLSLRRWLNARLRLGGSGRESLLALRDSLEARLPFRSVRIPIGRPGQERWLLLTGKPVLKPDGSFRGYRGVGSDITLMQASEQRIAWLARHDSLTRLPNRSHFHDMLQAACDGQTKTAQMAAGQTRAGQPDTGQTQAGRSLALLYLDLDGFKAINDTLGHLAGDTLLAQVAGRLQGCLRDEDLVGRLGGDEFAILLVDSDRNVAAAVARRLIAAVSASYTIDDRVIGVGLSIGIILSPDDAAGDARELLKGADLAMYRAKAEGRGTVRFFEPSMLIQSEARLLMQTDLRHAIARDELLLQFQPILDGRSGRVVAAEALVRWNHPGRGLIPPAEFIPIAEQSGLIVALGTWVLGQACREAMRWPESIGVSVNLSPLQLRDPALPAIVADALSVSGLPPHRLELELTESLFLETDPLVRESLHALKQRGIRIALDDFGTGFSSLSYLRELHVDIVKIDRSFVKDLGADPEADMIVQAITGMATGLGITITAEGVETADQADRLRESGCTQFQGYLFSRPCSPDDIARFIVTQNGAQNGAWAPSQGTEP